MLYKTIIFFLITVPLGGLLFLQGGSLLLVALGIFLYSLYVLIFLYFIELNHKNKLDHISQKNNELTKEIKSCKIKAKEFKKSAMYDPLTGLPNRLLLKDRLDQALLRSKRADKIFGLFFIDLDHFKQVNDTFGHVVGDQVLQAVALRLTNTLRAEDTISRIGGDEFVLLINQLHEEKDLQFVAEKVFQNLSAPYQVDGHSLTCTTSIGIALFPTGGKTSRELLSNSDNAMYQVKNNGGNRFLFYKDQN